MFYLTDQEGDSFPVWIQSPRKMRLRAARIKAAWNTHQEEALQAKKLHQAAGEDRAYRKTFLYKWRRFLAWLRSWRKKK
jgi:hypothetical protein